MNALKQIHKAAVNTRRRMELLKTDPEASMSAKHLCMTMFETEIGVFRNIGCTPVLVHLLERELDELRASIVTHSIPNN